MPVKIGKNEKMLTNGINNINNETKDDMIERNPNFINFKFKYPFYSFNDIEINFTLTSFIISSFSDSSSALSSSSINSRIINPDSEQYLSEES